MKAMNELGERKVVELACKKAELIYGWANKNKFLSCFIKRYTYTSINFIIFNDFDEIPNN